MALSKITADSITANVTLTSPVIASANLTTALTLNGAAGTNGQVLTSAGSGLPSWTTLSSGPTIVRSAITANTTLGTANASTLIDVTSGTITLAFTAAATLGSGWFCYIRNSGTGVITLDPNASELIDGLATYIMYPQETRLVQCTGTAFTSLVVSPFFATFTVTGTFTKPPGYTQFGVRMFGGGGGGSAGSSSTSGYACANASGGGGGGQRIIQIPASNFGTTETVTVGAGGTGQAGFTATPGASATCGGTSSLFTGANLINATGGGKAGSSSGGGGGGSGTDLPSGGVGAGPKFTYCASPGCNPFVIFGGCSAARKNQNAIGLSGAGSSSRSNACGNVGSSEYGGSAGARLASAGTPYPAGPSLFGATGGGHGKSSLSGGSSSGGAVGYDLRRNNIPACGAAGGTTGAGTAGSVLFTGAGGGGGGGGGCGSLGKVGGAGAQPGGGGGGGGNSITNGTGGAGGNGGDGIVYIWGVV